MDGKKGATIAKKWPAGFPGPSALTIPGNLGAETLEIGFRWTECEGASTLADEGWEAASLERQCGRAQRQRNFDRSEDSLNKVTVTYLEMRSADALRPKVAVKSDFRVAEAKVKQWEFNRFLYLLVGKDWGWNDKRGWTNEQWRAYVESDHLRTFVAYVDGSVAGYYESRPDDAGGLEIAIFGLAPRFIGRGLGGALLTHALEQAWRDGASRVWLHTCSLDHPAALRNYLGRGMSIYRVETMTVD